MLTGPVLGQSRDGNFDCLHAHQMCSVRNGAARHCMGRVEVALWDGHCHHGGIIDCTTKHRERVSSRAVQATGWHLKMCLNWCSSHDSPDV